MRILLFILTIAFAGELEIEGDLKVSGSIDAQNNPIKNVGIPQTLTDAINGNVLQDALRDDGQYEYTFIMVHLNSPANISDTVQNFFKKFNSIEGISHSHSMDDFYSYTTSLLNDGYKLESINGDNMSWWIFKRPIEE